MKKSIIVFVLLFAILSSIPCFAADVTLAWDANAEPVDGYRVYCSKQSMGYTFGVDSPDMVWEGTGTTATVSIDACGRHYFVATAFCVDDLMAEHESTPSNEVNAVVKPHDPKNLVK